MKSSSNGSGLPAQRPSGSPAPRPPAKVKVKAAPGPAPGGQPEGVGRSSADASEAAPAAGGPLRKADGEPAAAAKPAIDRIRELGRQGDLDTAAALVSRLLKAEPKNAEALLEYGLIKLRQKDREGAEAQFRQSLAIAPENPVARKFLGLVLLQAGQFEASLSELNVAVAKLGSDADVHYFISQARGGLKQYPEGLKAIGRALELRPESASYLNALGALFAQTGQDRRAVPVLYRALDLQPEFWQARISLGHVLMRLNRHKEAISHYNEVSPEAQDRRDLLANIGSAYAATDQQNAAAEVFERMLKLYPEDAGVHQAVANFTGRSNRYEESLAHYRRALELQPVFPEAHNNLAITLRRLNRVEESLNHLDLAVAQRPDFADAAWNRALSLLLLGRLPEGFEQYEWRWKGGVRDLRPRKLGAPVWQPGEPIAGKRVLVHSEQGLGDHIQFMRYLPLLADRGATVLAEFPEPLLDLCRTAMPQVEWIERGNNVLPQADLVCPLLSLAHRLGTTLDTIPFPAGYLSVSPARLRKFDDLLGPRRRRRVGLVWSGNPKHQNDANRSMSLPSMLAHLGDIDADFISLMKEARPSDAEFMRSTGRVRDLSAQIDDFQDTAALLELVDVAVTVDTSVAHLAGALGRPIWVLVPFAPDWRWLIDRPDTPWYRSMRLFRQHEPHSWEGAMADVAASLQELKA